MTGAGGKVVCNLSPSIAVGVDCEQGKQIVYIPFNLTQLLFETFAMNTIQAVHEW